MKYLIGLLLVALHLNAAAQIKGNKKMVTKTYGLQNVKSIEMNLYAQVVIDCAAEEKMTITAEENMLDLIEKSVEGGHLKLTQKEWIQPNYRIKIHIGTPGLERIQNTVHETTGILTSAFSTTRGASSAMISSLTIGGVQKCNE